jgi:hypothetical protein
LQNQARIEKYVNFYVDIFAGLRIVGIMPGSTSCSQLLETTGAFYLFVKLQ